MNKIISLLDEMKKRREYLATHRAMEDRLAIDVESLESALRLAVKHLDYFYHSGCELVGPCPACDAQDTLSAVKKILSGGEK